MADEMVNLHVRIPGGTKEKLEELYKIENKRFNGRWKTFAEWFRYWLDRWSNNMVDIYLGKPEAS